MFKNLDRYDISQATHWVRMPELGAGARICIRPALEQNAAFTNAMLKLTGARLRSMKGSDITAEDLDQNRRDDRKLYPRYIIAGWEGVESDTSTLENVVLVDFSRLSATRLCEQLPDVLFDRLRTAAGEAVNFFGEEPIPDAEELAKNSESD